MSQSDSYASLSFTVRGHVKKYTRFAYWVEEVAKSWSGVNYSVEGVLKRYFRVSSEIMAASNSWVKASSTVEGVGASYINHRADVVDNPLPFWFSVGKDVEDRGDSYSFVNTIVQTFSDTYSLLGTVVQAPLYLYFKNSSLVEVWQSLYVGASLNVEEIANLYFSQEVNVQTSIDAYFMHKGEVENFSNLWSGITTTVNPSIRFDPLPGTYDEPQEVSVIADDVPVSITYTLDGSEPDLSSPEYKQSIQINRSKTIRVMAVFSGGYTIYLKGDYVIENEYGKVLYQEPSVYVSVLEDSLWKKS